MTRRARQWEATWELYHMTVNRQDRRVTFRNIVKWGFTPREAVEMIHDCEREG